MGCIDYVLKFLRSVPLMSLENESAICGVETVEIFEPAVSQRCDRHWRLVCFSSLFFFCHIARNSEHGRKKWEDHFVGSESLSVMTAVIFATWLTLLFVSFNVIDLN